MGHLQSAATAATVARLLLASPPAASLSATTAPLAAAGSGVHCRHCGLLSLLLERAGGQCRHHVMSVLAVVGGEQAHSGALRLLVRHVHLQSRMWSSLGSLLRSKQLKKLLFSWPLGQKCSTSARSSNGFWAVRGGRLKSCSTH